MGYIGGYMRKLASLLFVCLMMLMASVAFAEVTGNEIVRVGLNYMEKHVSSAEVSSQDPLALFASVERKAVKIFDCDAKTATFEKGSASRVNVIYDKRFSTFNEMYSAVGNLRKSNSQSFYYYDQGWYLVLGRYDSASQASGKLSSFSGVSKGDLTTRNTKADDVYILVNGKTQMAYSSASSDFFVAPSDYPSRSVVTYGGTTYRGGIATKRSGTNDMAVVNYLVMDHYLYGILPKEMSANWPKEALKAQAVVARNFSITNFNKHDDEGYDLCNNTHCQVYGGYSVEGVGSNLAVDESTGDLLYYNDELVTSYYHSNSGGRTASIEHVWSAEVPYLVSVNDPYSVGSPNTDWMVMMSPQEIVNKLSNQNYFIGTLKNVHVTDVADDGRVQEIEFIGTKGIAVLKKEEMRKVFGYVAFKSIWYEVLTDNIVSVANNQNYDKVSLPEATVIDVNGVSSLAKNAQVSIKGAAQDKTIEMTPSTYTFVGHGFGHGIGMSQWGAKKMAEDGYSYEDILMHYYTGTHLINN